MPLSDYSKKQVMESLFKKAFVSLHSKGPGTGGINEISGKGYARQSGEKFYAPSPGIMKNGDNIIFDDLPSVEVTHVGIWDSIVGGNLLWSAELMVKKTVLEGDAIIFKKDKIMLEII